MAFLIFLIEAPCRIFAAWTLKVRYTLSGIHTMGVTAYIGNNCIPIKNNKVRIMPEQSNTNPEQNPTSPLVTTPPYEAALVQAINKLTSEVFIFLLAYVILLIGIAVFGESLTDTLRNLLYIIPILGVAAYVFLKRGEVVKEADARGIVVKAGVVRRDGYVGGKRGKTSSGSNGKVDVRSGWTDGTVVGLDEAYEKEPEPNTPQSSGSQYLLEIYEDLSEENRRKLVASANRLRTKQV
jgi:hypothetical protein